jgi:hypothetical protein
MALLVQACVDGCNNLQFVAALSVVGLLQHVNVFLHGRLDVERAGCVRVDFRKHSVCGKAVGPAHDPEKGGHKALFIPEAEACDVGGAPGCSHYLENRVGSWRPVPVVGAVAQGGAGFSPFR